MKSLLVNKWKNLASEWLAALWRGEQVVVVMGDWFFSNSQGLEISGCTEESPSVEPKLIFSNLKLPRELGNRQIIACEYISLTLWNDFTLYCSSVLFRALLTSSDTETHGGSRKTAERINPQGTHSSTDSHTHDISAGTTGQSSDGISTIYVNKLLLLGLGSEPVPDLQHGRS